MMSKKYILPALLMSLSIFVTQVPAALAQEAPQAELSAEEQAAQQNQTMLDNLDRLAREADPASSPAFLDLYADLTIKKRGYIAQAVSVRDKTVKVKSLDGSEQFLTFDKSTDLIKTGKETTADQVDVSEWIEIDDWMVVIGVEEDDQFLPRRILISSTNLEPKEKVVKIGTVNSYGANKLAYTPRGASEAQEIKTDKNTVFEDRDGNPIKASQIKADQSALVTGLVSSTGSVAKTIRILSVLD